MIQRLKALLSGVEQASPAHLSTEELKLATAALLVEVATIDQNFDDTELDALQTCLVERFALSADELQDLTNLAKNASSEAYSLYQFTKLINTHCDDQQKYELACGLWVVAYADGHLDKYEEHIIRRIADLIHLRHSDFIRAKHQARDATIMNRNIFSFGIFKIVHLLENFAVGTTDVFEHWVDLHVEKDHNFLWKIH